MPNDKAILGTGWSFPPRFNKHLGAVEMVSGEQDVQESLQILFTTELGERIMLPDFGCKLQDLVFAEIDAELLSSIERTVENAILRYEQRIILQSVDISEDRSRPGLLLINVSYVIRLTKAPGSFVYQFHLMQA